MGRITSQIYHQIAGSGYSILMHTYPEMEVNEAAERRVVIAKPVACRPTCNSTFSEVLAGAINASSTTRLSQTSSIAAIMKPKTLRFNPPPPASPSQAQCPTIIYRPQAKLVSKRTASLLANVGSFNSFQQETPLTHSPGEEAGEELSQPGCCNAQVEEATERLRISTQQLEGDIPKAALLAASVQVACGERPSYDGYNWRKYGQKQVKGSEYPRSYYKCTHPSCPVKKKVERSLDGQIAEIVYKGEHNHSKPSLPATRIPLGYCEVVGGETRIESDIEVQGDHDEPTSKRRRAEDHTNDQPGGRRETAGADTEVLGDGFRWRKYGQKVVRGNLYPRSYYRCTNSKCKVRKYVERSPDDPNALVTTYEGKHNHDIPAP